jgi:hypothetical protein
MACTIFCTIRANDLEVIDFRKDGGPSRSDDVFHAMEMPCRANIDGKGLTSGTASKTGEIGYLLLICYQNLEWVQGLICGGSALLMLAL